MEYAKIYGRFTNTWGSTLVRTKQNKPQIIATERRGNNIWGLVEYWTSNDVRLTKWVRICYTE